MSGRAPSGILPTHPQTHRHNFDGICKKLRLDSEIQSTAWDIYVKIAAQRITPLPDQTKTVRAYQIWSACAIFMASYQNVYPNKNVHSSTTKESIRLSQLLCVTNISFNDFVEHVSLVFNKLAIGSDALERLRVLKEAFLCTHLLWGKFSILFDECLRWGKSTAEARTNYEKYGLQLKKFAWIFFLLAKKHVVGSEPDLSLSYHTLIASLHWIFDKCPWWTFSSRAKKNHTQAEGSLHNVSDIYVPSLSNENGVGAGVTPTKPAFVTLLLLQELCEFTHLHEDDVASSCVEVFKFTQTCVNFSPNGSTSSSPSPEKIELRYIPNKNIRKCESTVKINQTTPVNISSILDQLMLTSNIYKMDEFYSKRYLTTIVDLDERSFIDCESRQSLCTPSKPGKCTIVKRSQASSSKAISNSSNSSVEHGILSSGNVTNSNISEFPSRNLFDKQNLKQSLKKHKEKNVPVKNENVCLNESIWSSPFKRNIVGSSPARKNMLTPLRMKKNPMSQHQTFGTPGRALAATYVNSWASQYFVPGQYSKSVQNETNQTLLDTSCQNSNLNSSISSSSSATIGYSDLIHCTPPRGRCRRRYNENVIQTPISASIASRRWFEASRDSTRLKTVPSAALLLFFRACEPNPKDLVAKIVEDCIKTGDNIIEDVPSVRVTSSCHLVLDKSTENDNNNETKEDDDDELSKIISNPASSGDGGSTPIPFPLSGRYAARSQSVTEMLVPPCSKTNDYEDNDRKEPPLPPRKMSSKSRVELAEAECRSVAKILFYRVLETILFVESRRLQRRDFGGLLNNPKFHRSLLLCSLEVALKSRNMVASAFPHTLSTFEITAFDLCKVVESFIKHSHDMPPVLKRHMASVEEQLIESLAWSDGQAPPNLFDHSNSPKKTNFKETKGDDVKKESEKTASAPITLLIRKTQKLAANRILELSGLLKIPTTTRDQIWTTVKWCIENARDLLRNRHIDNVILSSVYGVSKVNKLKPEVTFKNIIHMYKRQQCRGINKVAVMRDIRLNDDGTTRGDIIKFYNDIFIPRVKHFLMKLAPSSILQRRDNRNTGTACSNQGVTTNKQVMIQSDSRVTPMSPHKLHSLSYRITSPNPTRVRRTNVYMSRSPRKVQMTPRTRVLYAFGESPRRDLSLINRSVLGNNNNNNTVNRETNAAMNQAKNHVLSMSRFVENTASTRDSENDENIAAILRRRHPAFASVSKNSNEQSNKNTTSSKRKFALIQEGNKNTDECPKASPCKRVKH